MQPLFSIVIPIYNTEKYLSAAVDSIISQGFDSYELLLIDDGSHDSCPQIIDEYARRVPQIRGFHKENGGTYSGYNLGIEMATGKYTIFLSSDDYCDPRMFEILSQQAQMWDYDMIFMNVASHTCDAEQNIIKANFQNSVMTQPFSIIGKKNIEENWIHFLSLGLVRNPVNAYRSEIIKKYRFRTDIYGADYLMNITVADDIKSAACHHLDLYHGLVYPAIEDKSFNISTGKFNTYEHDMFNEFYDNYLQLLSKWDLLDEDAKNMLAQLRLTHLDTELINISSFSNTQTPAENIATIASYFDETIARACEITQKRKVIEELLIDRCVLQYIQAHDKIEDADHFMVQMVALLTDRLLSPRKKAQRLVPLIVDEENPYHLGLCYLQQLCAGCDDDELHLICDYITQEERSRGMLLTGKYIDAAENIVRLFEMPVSEPEKYLILGRNCINLGFAEDGVNTYYLGLDSFPDNKRLKEALIQAGVSING